MSAFRKNHMLTALVAAALLAAAPVGATVFTGTLYYTNFTGALNVNKVAYSYDDVTFIASLGAATNVGSTPGADGIIFAPNGNLLIGGQGAGAVYEVNPSTGAIVSSATAGGHASFHLTLDPSGSKVWTSDFGGPLVDLALPLAAGTAHTVSGDDGGLTQIAFAPNGNVFYVNGSPNGFGNVGLINLTTFGTVRLFSSLQPAHGMIYDSFTDLITMFGAGEVGTIDTSGGSLKTRSGINCDFDQGAVDGKGHALVAGCSGITFIDYSATGDITSPLNHISIFGGFDNIDDVAPLSGLGSQQVPEPASLALLCLGLAGLGFSRRRKA